MDTQQAEPCYFCERRPGRTKEHAWSDWFNKVWPNEGNDAYTFRLIKGKDELVRSFKSQGFSYKIGGYCESCNHGWMSRIENRASRVLPGLMLGTSRHVSAQGLRDIASWAYLKSLVFSTGTPELEIPRNDFRKFYARRKPLESNSILISAVDHQLTGGFIRLEPLIVHETNGASPRFSSYRATFVLGHVMIHVFGHKVRVDDVAPMYRRKAADLMVRIWPSHDRDINWPPKMVLNRQGVVEALQYFENVPVPKHPEDYREGPS